MKPGEEAPFEEGVSSPGPPPFPRLSTGGEGRAGLRLPFVAVQKKEETA